MEAKERERGTQSQYNRGRWKSDCEKKSSERWDKENVGQRKRIEIKVNSTKL